MKLLANSFLKGFDRIRFPLHQRSIQKFPRFEGLQSCGSAASFSATTAGNFFDRNERPRRSLLSVPGSDKRKIQKASGLQADAVVLDLEDGVPFDQKDEARRLVVEALEEQEETGTLFPPSTELCVRINGLETGKVALKDLQTILPCASLQSIVVPKIEHASDIDFVSRMISMVTEEAQRDVRILAAIESARGLLNSQQICHAGTGGSMGYCYLDALIFASEDYCADLESIRTQKATELIYARSQLVTVAKAYGLQAIDMVHINFKNLEDLRNECQEGREMGFTGKQAIHPMQLETIHESFAPSPKDITFAQNCVREYESVTADGGKGACVVDGIVVDAPVYKWALKILKRANKAGLID